MARGEVVVKVLVSGVLECDCCGHLIHFLHFPEDLGRLDDFDCPRCFASMEILETTVWGACEIVEGREPMRPFLAPQISPRIPGAAHNQPEIP